MSFHPDFAVSSEDCPFCAICLAYPPTDPLTEPERLSEVLAPNDRTSLPTQMIYAGDHVLAFLDIQPMTRGHTLVIPRAHTVRMGDLSGDEGAELGRALPLLVRSVIRAVFDIPYAPNTLIIDNADYNIVQNNGPLAAQVVPHVHHHIIPRPNLNCSEDTAAVPSRSSEFRDKIDTSWKMFGRGNRTDLDENDVETQRLVRRMRGEFAREFQRDVDGPCSDGQGQRKGKL